jgi:hypothetical protein
MTHNTVDQIIKYISGVRGLDIAVGVTAVSHEVWWDAFDDYVMILFGAIEDSAEVFVRWGGIALLALRILAIFYEVRRAAREDAKSKGEK